MPFLPISHRFVIENWWFYFKHEHLFFFYWNLEVSFQSIPFQGIDRSNNEEDTKCFDICSTNSASFLTYDDDWFHFFPSSFGREYFPLGPFAMAIGWKVKRYFAASISRIYQIVGLFCWHRWWCHCVIATATATATAAEIYPWSFKWKKFEMNYTKQTMLESKNAEMLWKVLSLENFAESISIDCESFIVEYYNKFIWKYRNEWLGSCLTNFLELIRP